MASYKPIVSILPCLAVLVISACSEEPIEISEPVIRPVKYERVAIKGGTRIRSFSGVARAGQESDISFRVGGTITRIAVDVGDTVQQGTLIAEVDSTDLELRHQEAVASLDQARAQSVNAEANLDRIRNLYEKNNATVSDLDTAQTAADSAKATVQAIQKRVDLAGQQISYTTLRAPVAGVISDVPVEVNENVSPGEPIVTLTAGVLAEVEVAIPEQLIAQIREGDLVTVHFDAFPGRAFRARITEVAVVSSPSATTFPVTVQLIREADRVLPGMAAEVEFEFPDADLRRRISVPPNSVGEDREGRFVFVLESEGQDLALVRRRSVRVGELSSDGLEIVEGLKEGERIVTAGVSKIQDGLTVRLPPSGGI